MSKDKLVPALVVMVVVAAFAVGMLYGKVQVYEKNLGSGGGTQQAAAGDPQAPQAPPEEAPLTEEQWDKLLAGAEFVKGDDDAPITMVEFTDYECPFCTRYYTETYGQIMKDYVDTGKVRYITRDLPLSFHPQAKPAALAARCAGDQGKYYEMHDLLFENQTSWSTGNAAEAFEGYAREIGLNVSQYTSCYEANTHNEAIDADLALAQEMGIGGTPSFVIEGDKLIGAQPYTAFQALLDRKLGE